MAAYPHLNKIENMPPKDFQQELSASRLQSAFYQKNAKKRGVIVIVIVIVIVKIIIVIVIVIVLVRIIGNWILKVDRSSRKNWR